MKKTSIDREHILALEAAEDLAPSDPLVERLVEYIYLLRARRDDLLLACNNEVKKRREADEKWGELMNKYRCADCISQITSGSRSSVRDNP